jgi:hypothetical protein
LALSSKLFREGTYPAELFGGVSGKLNFHHGSFLGEQVIPTLKNTKNCMYLYSHQQCIQQQVLFVNGRQAALQFF